MTIKAIFFDAAGTLIQPARRVGESYATVARKYGMDVAPSELSARFNECFDSAPPLAFPKASPAQIEEMEREWWKRLVRHIFAPWGFVERFDDYFEELFAYFAQADAWTLYPEVRETLTTLKQQGLILGVISNFDSRLLTILKGLEIACSFDGIFISSRAGYAKPARQIFHMALNRHALSPECALHVGDSEEKDVYGANRAGLTGIHVVRGGHHGSVNGPRITSLKEIITLLGDQT
jgi:putative hydrolase of the HAD superfamily